VRTYYLKQSSTLNPPAKPTSNPPGGSWSTTEPAYTAGSTDTLYTVMLTAYGTVAHEYGDVQKSSSYEAAKQAYNAAQAAQGTANTALTTANGKNKVIFSTSAASGTTGYVAGDLWFRKSGSLITGQWEFTTSWQARTLDNAVIANLDAGKITTGYLDVANRIQANSISATKMVLGDLTNYFHDRYLLDDATSEFFTGGAIDDSETPPAGGRFFRWSGSGASGNAGGRRVVYAAPGDEFVIEYTRKIVSGSVAALTLYQTQVVSSPALIEDLGDGWQRYRTIVRIITPRPGGETFLWSKTLTGEAWFTDIVVRRRNGGELIVDGAITADKITVNEALADKFFGNSATFGKISVNHVEPAFGDDLMITVDGEVVILAGAVESAQEAADVADGKANTAQEDATTANTSAGIAQSTANNAATAAGAAQDTANTANNNASTALTNASIAQTKANDASSLAEDVSERLDTHQTYYRFGTEGLFIGDPSSTSELRLKPDRIEMAQNGVPISWWEGGVFVADEVLLAAASIGNHKFEQYGPGRTIVRPI